MENPSADLDWKAHSAALAAWIEDKFGGDANGDPGLAFGARTISEQEAYNFKMASHTGRFAAVNALYAAATGDAATKEKAFRSLNWCTYMCRDTGSVIEGPAEFKQNHYNWFSDGHGDYIRHFMLAMGAFPEWAPHDENHLLHSTSVVKNIAYDAAAIRYETFDKTAIEVLRLVSTPQSVNAGGQTLTRRPDLSQPGWSFDAKSGVLKIRHDAATKIQILHEKYVAPQTMTTPIPQVTPPAATKTAPILGSSAEGTFADTIFAADPTVQITR